MINFIINVTHKSLKFLVGKFHFIIILLWHCIVAFKIKLHQYVENIYTGFLRPHKCKQTGWNSIF